MKKFFYFLIFLFFCSCINNNRKESSFSVVETIIFSNDENNPADKCPEIDRVTIVPLESSVETLIGTIQSVHFGDSIIALSDLNDKLFIFDNNGKFVRKIGNMGNGAEEYNAIGSFCLDNDNRQVLIFDHIKNEILRYQIDGKFVSKTKLQSYKGTPYSCFLLDNELVLVNNKITPWDDAAYQEIEVSTGKIQQTMYYSGISVEGYMFAFSNHPISGNKDDLHFIMPLCDTVFRCYGGQFEPLFVIRHANKMAPVDQYKLSDKSNMVGLDFENVKMNLFTGFKDIFETKDHILLNYGITGYNSGYFFANKSRLQGSYHRLASIADVDNPFVSFDEEIKTMPFFKIKASDGDSFISVVQAYQLLAMKDKIEDSSDDNLKRLRTLIDSLDEEDNPLLFFYKIKEN